MGDNGSKIVHWHRALPPIASQFLAEHTVEADSSRVPGTIAHHDELWVLYRRPADSPLPSP
jgi:hypothetical protein